MSSWSKERVMALYCEIMLGLEFLNRTNVTCHALVDCWSNPVVVFTCHDHLSKLEGSKVGDAELDKLSSETLSVMNFYGQSLHSGHTAYGAYQQPLKSQQKAQSDPGSVRPCSV